ncbi:hypothetical protein KM176_13305 [Pseudooceanicola sp. CBS1P-1]|uniref:Uncharacterized protein n=1 Tax=Pseudooceanicola albus TaxID=2692189 RepID=A0A6L7G279_9RHOB|nr:MULTISPECIES: hypothetical protein [Pseudooceanicola]MBT9384841.1 hypothetical protein [Pseudooceanicola endophyticus]MXN18165.1 hypothetical protein [Pseudooceanicola albus]
MSAADESRQTRTAEAATPPPPRSWIPAEALGLIAGLGWAAGAAALMLPKTSDMTATVPVVILPAALILSVTLLGRGLRHQRAALAALTAAQARGPSSTEKSAAAAREATLLRRLEELAQAQRRLEAELKALVAAPEPAVAPPSRPEAQAPLPLDEAPGPAPLSRDDFIRALNFPETAEDAAGFAALRRAMADRPAGLMIRAAQDVLTLLSQNDVFMDDLHSDPARPELWRRFAAGERAGQVASLGGIRDRAALATVAERMKQDPVFRDAVHHFLRRYDTMLELFCAEASDAEIRAMADTRTSRAFMLLGRVAGVFDQP